MPTAGELWIRFLRHYGPIPQSDNMYDERIMGQLSGLV